MPSRRAFLGAAATLAGAAAAGALPAEPMNSGTSSSPVDPAGIPLGGGARVPPASEPDSSRVRVRILGTVQDGGLPQLGCERACCVAARGDPSRARRVASLGLFGGMPGTVVLVDATPDIRSQVAELRESAGIEAPPGLPVDRILLTHAHIGHYTGLIHLGRESMSARSVPIMVTPRMRDFLGANKPWSRLVEWGHVRLETIAPGSRSILPPVTREPRVRRPPEFAPESGAQEGAAADGESRTGLAVEAIEVPHRDEDSDTIGFIFKGATRRLLYVPDTDAWEKWPRPLESYLAEVDVALLDGTFFDGAELPGRDLAQIPHPLVKATMEMLERKAAAGRCRILFTHFNHSNPALDPGSAEAENVRKKGFEIACEGMEFPL